MDFLRSCYATKMRFYPTTPTILTDVEWYWCYPDAKALPRYHRFASRNWSYPLKGSDTLGEVWHSARPYRKGIDTHAFPGDRSCTPVAYWTAGAPAPVPVQDWDECCGKMVGRARLGFLPESTSDQGGASRFGRAKVGFRAASVLTLPPDIAGAIRLASRAIHFVSGPPVYIVYGDLGFDAIQTTYVGDAIGYIGDCLVELPPDYLGEVEVGYRAAVISTGPVAWTGEADLGFQGFQTSGNAHLGLRVSAYSKYTRGVVCIRAVGTSYDRDIAGPTSDDQYREFEGSLLDTWTIHFETDPDPIPGYPVILAPLRNGAFWGQFINRYPAVGLITIFVNAPELCGDAPDILSTVSLGERGSSTMVSGGRSETGAGRDGLRGGNALTLPSSLSSSIQLGLRGSATATPVASSGFIQATNATGMGSAATASISGVVSGNVCLAILSVNNFSPFVTTPSGWTLVATQVNGTFSGCLLVYKNTSASGTVNPNFDFSGFTYQWSLIVEEYGGVTGTVYNVGTSSGSGNAVTTHSIASTHSADVLVACVHTGGIANTFGSQTAGWTKDKENSPASAPSEATFSYAPASGTYTMTCTCSNSSGVGVATVILALAVP